MGKATKRKQEAKEAKKPNFPVLLTKAKKEAERKHDVYLKFDILSFIKDYTQYAIRPIDKFVPRTKSISPSTRVRELVRYAFNRYKPPDFLYSLWDVPYETPPRGPLSPPQQHFNSERAALQLFGVKEDFRLWYLDLVQGRSLYKERTMGLLTKRETFYFSTCPYIFLIPQAIWYSVIRCLDEEAPSALARKIACTKIATCKIDDFWRGVARWFMLHETSIKEMNDLLDYISARHRENPEWYLKDQILYSLSRSMKSWHRELNRTSRMSTQYKSWEGIKVPNSTIERGAGAKKIIWRFRQIKTGKELAEEGSKQHHCVSSYGAKCSSGECSIWSLKCSHLGVENRALTIEVSRDGRIVQARGYANRLPKNAEIDILREWAAMNGFGSNYK